MRDLNYQLKQICRHNRDGSYSTQAKCFHHLMMIANQLHDLGFHGMKPRSLKPKHVDALVEHWMQQDLAVGTIKNRMSVLRCWAEKVDKQNVIARSNDHYGIPDRQFVSNYAYMNGLQPMPDYRRCTAYGMPMHSQDMKNLPDGSLQLPVDP
jgi:hypothetical protein